MTARCALHALLLSGAFLLLPVQAAQSVPAAPSPAPVLPEILPVAPAPRLSAPPLVPVAPGSVPVPAPVTPADPLFPAQWNLNLIRMPQAWVLERGAPVTVAVLDTGFVRSSELGARAVNGYDFVSTPARAGDGTGRDADASAVGEFSYHGEVIANLIGAAHDGRGMAGINPQARVVHVRVAAVDGTIEVPDLVDGLKWAAGLSVPGVPVNPNPAKLLNLSLFADFIPLTGCDPRVQAAVDAVTARGAMVIAGAANDGQDAAGYSPAGCRNVLTVTSVTEAGLRPAYANWGRAVALAAPGGDERRGVPSVSSSGSGGERRPNGTSFAAPHVTGVASLLLGVRPKLSPGLLRSYLTRSAAPFPNRLCDPQPARTCGAGTLNAEAALKLALASSLGR
ncbi:S8 family serine peptidase [Deinococcus taeanensis]|uniref:S8 family serine peptidase n=1 Tax=Deinococcus taeanensis TaxID=2737050 RepID=UPI001CDD2F5C|nr:S8 family serine peptidase [Deinococcus taeanensis]UBV42906.1 S8 family serine peptidase [Deinococcus taeanensis]